MTSGRSPQSPNRNLKKIELPEEIKTFFQQRGKFVRGLPGYEQIEGLNPEDHDRFFDYTYGFPKPLKESHPVNNEPQKAYDKAQKHAKTLLSKFFGVSEKETGEPLREYMLTGGTKPIRVTAQIKNRGKRIYVKMSSIERIVGLSLYNLICNEDPIDFLFSEYVFVEDSVKGQHLDSNNTKYHQRIPKLGESIVRLAMQDRFIGINDLDRTIDLPEHPDMIVNILLQPSGHATAFDIDCAFTKNFPDYDLVDLFRQRGIDIPKETEERIKQEEAKRINLTIHGKSKKAYQRFIKVMDEIEQLVEQFKKLGFKSAEHYFKEKESWLKSQF